MTTQVRAPTSDITHTGGWNPTASMYSYIDDSTTPSGHDSNTTRLFSTDTSPGKFVSGYSAFSVPAGVTITNVKIYATYRELGGGANAATGLLRLSSGTDYMGSYDDPITSFVTYEYAWATNPATGLAWTIDEINGVGANSLAGFGMDATDVNPEIAVTQVYIEVTYVTPPILKSVAGGLTLGGLVVKKGVKIIGATLTLAGLISKVAKRNLISTLTFSGTVIKVIKKLFAGALIFTGSVVRKIFKLLTSGVSFTGAIAKQVKKVLVANLTFTAILAGLALVWRWVVVHLYEDN